MGLERLLKNIEMTQGVIEAFNKLKMNINYKSTDQNNG